MNNYRVDVNQYGSVPCGMNHIAYIGGSLLMAKRHYMGLQINKDNMHFGEPIVSGVLSKWCDSKRDFIIIDQFNFGAINND